MCGIFAYTGSKKASPILLEGLSMLEYRGYDSAGIYMPGFDVVKTPGAVAELTKRMTKDYPATSGIAHLRWATHGAPNEVNAHPHGDCDGDVFVIHNGIIENFRELKEELLAGGHTFKSETDTEVIAHLIEGALKDKLNFEDAVIDTLKKLRGTYGLLISYAKDPDTIITARMGSPVVVGLGDGENFIASDATPILKHTKQMMFLSDGDVAIITPTTHRVRTLLETEVDRPSETITWDVGEASRGGYPHFMLKEMMESPEVIENALRGRLIMEEGKAKLGGLEAVEKELQNIDRLIIVGCGTAYYAGLIGEYLIESLAGVPVEVELASEFRYRKPVIRPNTAVLAISQSGETLDTLEAIREAKRHGALTLGIVNTVGSTIARETDAGVYNHAGPEIGVASTKALVSQVVILSLVALFLGRTRSLSKDDGVALANALKSLPELAKKVLEQSEEIRKVANVYKDSRDFLFIGRKFSYPAALEGALKLKEVSYVHAEGYGAGEMKHGPLAMIDEKFPTVAIVPQDSVYEKTVSNMIEIRTRKGPVIAIATAGDEKIKEVSDHVIYIPKASEELSVVLSIIALQLFAYHFAADKGLNVDRPRNLAKSVTVE
ncbi:MAG: glutamine--fructose-6-phosphate transaminase (isomerizing) [Candidatus Pacebacteria bacterium]|nr:glutamine--fructose-6-phosphate transaminase (isomerizing) [Candidatus Paceibacterota bacterium]MBP9832000.1 glutamine--fructose-6-phosphate transaminase (isomerizing) [Candidatus Paceibacterota bacterium]